MFPLGHHHSAWTLLVGAQATPPDPPALPGLWTPPQPGPSGAKPEILTHLFHGNQQRLEVFALPSLRAPCLLLSWLCVPSSPLCGDTHLSLSGAVMWAQLWILLCHSNAMSNMFLHFNSQCFFPSSHSKDYALTFLKLPLNFNSCSQPT